MLSNRLVQTVVALAFLALSLLVAMTAESADPQTEPESSHVQRFTPSVFVLPKMIGREKKPRFFGESDRRDGWGILNLLVGKDGKTLESKVMLSTGYKSLDEWALKIHESAMWSPATSNGLPIDYRGIVKYHVSFKEPPNASESIIRSFKIIAAAIRSGDRATADAQLAIMKSNNNKNCADYALTELADYEFQKQWGDAFSQYDALSHALADGQSGYTGLKTDFYEYAVVSYLKLNVTLGRLKDALMFYESLDDKTASKIKLKLASLVASINEVRFSDKSIAVNIRLNETGYGRLSLLRRAFEIQDGFGNISKISLSCDTGEVQLKIMDSYVYKVDGPAGNCQLFIQGKPGGKVVFIEHPIQKAVAMATPLENNSVIVAPGTIAPLDHKLFDHDPLILSPVNAGAGLSQSTSNLPLSTHSEDHEVTPANEIALKSTDQMAQKLQTLYRLLKEGVITQVDFDKKKSEILKAM